MELPTQERHTAMTRSGHILALYGGLALLALLIAAGRGDVDLYRLRDETTGLQLLLSPLLGIGIGLLVVVLSRLAVRHFAWARQLHREFRSILGEQTARELLILALASSIGEELLFRGALMPWMGIWPQALIFAGLHVGPGRRFLPWTLAAFAIGLGFGYLADATGDLGAPITAHFVINYLNLRFIVATELPDEPTLEASEVAPEG
jgi:membrane protease YdiL (CAAX protease family)